VAKRAVGLVDAVGVGEASVEVAAEQRMLALAEGVGGVAMGSPEPAPEVVAAAVTSGGRAHPPVQVAEAE